MSAGFWAEASAAAAGAAGFLSAAILPAVPSVSANVAATPYVVAFTSLAKSINANLSPNVLGILIVAPHPGLLLENRPIAAFP
jgi:hypothetical protein